ncbi:hypothetical protein BDV33DRAFT_204110 [Aspergillus novoparasiticus]|uniref:Uncharacterized protein n=1 Tax=Aspergillus novoparasiticus TaxID=986946 RepID=A0A5N6EQB7_9EURO|nr:hypothetical protein BDV33DRAFT_204110 [Aspergillus novoparasiticus]
MKFSTLLLSAFATYVAANPIPSAEDIATVEARDPLGGYQNYDTYDKREEAEKRDPLGGYQNYDTYDKVKA